MPPARQPDQQRITATDERHWTGATLAAHGTAYGLFHRPLAGPPELHDPLVRRAPRRDHRLAGGGIQYDPEARRDVLELRGTHAEAARQHEHLAQLARRGADPAGGVLVDVVAAGEAIQAACSPASHASTRASIWERSTITS